MYPFTGLDWRTGLLDRTSGLTLEHTKKQFSGLYNLYIEQIWGGGGGGGGGGGAGGRKARSSKSQNMGKRVSRRRVRL